MTQNGRLIPVPNLDDRDWRMIKDSLIKKIPSRCPEWTDFNLSDPGITLIELFAMGMEELNYRLNQVLPKHLKEYLNLIGVSLTPASCAKTKVYFKLSGPQSFDVTLPKGFEVAAGGDTPIVFTTDQDLIIHAARLYRLWGYQQTIFNDYTSQAYDPAVAFNPLPETLSVNDCVYFGYHPQNYFQKLSLEITTPASGISGVWEYSRLLSDGSLEWCQLSVDNQTLGFTQSGEIAFTIPADWDALEVNGVSAVWLCFRVTAIAPSAQFSVMRNLKLDDIFGRVSVSQAAQIKDEVIGSSDGAIDQRFYLSQVPVLDVDLFVDEGAGFQAWQQVDDFSLSGAEDKHFRINQGTGEVLFGDNRKGKTPLEGNNNIKVSFRYGGGVKGNLGAYSITSLRSSRAFIDSCHNKEPAIGGADEETIDQAIERGPSQQLKTRDRAVTADDFETLSLQSSPAISRAKALALYDPSFPDSQTPGAVSVITVPQGGGGLNQALRESLLDYLNQRRLVTCKVYVLDADYVSVDFDLTVVKSEKTDALLLSEKVQQAIIEFLHPEYGGEVKTALDYIEGRSKQRGSGWEFGRPVYLSEVYALLEGLSGIDHVEEIVLPPSNIILTKTQLPITGSITVRVL